MEKRGLRGIPRLVRAAVCSMQGMRFAWKNQEAFRLEVLAALILIPLAFWWSEHAVERILLIGSVFLVMIVELLNSAVETAVDRIGMEHHVLSGMAKDISSAAVLLTLILVPFVWGMILLG